MALNVFAAQWGVLMMYYGAFHARAGIKSCEEKDLPEFLPALSAYLCAISASMLYRAKIPRNKAANNKLFVRERIYPWLIGLLGLPSIFQSPNGDDIKFLPISHSEIEVLITFLLKVIGFYSLYQAIKLQSNKNKLNQLAYFFLLIYTLLEFSYATTYIYKRQVLNDMELVMTPFYLYSFGIIKIFTTFLVIPAILMSVTEFKKSSFLDRFFHYIHTK